jgi:Lar family restriction alleviation protein
MTEPTKAQPCPFCGGNARKVKHSAGVPGTTGYDRWHGVACAGCNACVGARDRRFRTSAAAIAVWNTRTPQPTQAQAGAVPLTRERVKAILTECGYDGASAQHRADFINGLRHGEAAHGIKGGQHGNSTT